MIERSLDARTICLVVLAGFLLRAFVAALTPIPAEDGANYLWMAERLAAGDTAAALSEVFGPGLPLLTAPWIVLGFDPFRAGQVVTVICGALALWPMMRAVEVLAPRYGVAAGVMLVCAPLAVRFGGKVYSEPVFHLFGAFALWAMTRRSFVAAGCAAGAAFWVRPEAAAFALAFLVADRRRGWLGVLPLALSVVGLAAWRDASGHGFDLLPKLALHVVRGDTPLTSDGFEAIRVLQNIVALPGIWLEAFQVLGVLAVFGMWVARRDRQVRPLFTLLAVGLVAICLFLPRRRFLVSWLFVIAPFAVAGLARIPTRGRWPTVLVVALTSLLASLRLEPTDRIGEREVGVYLRDFLAPGETVAGDMTRVIWYAGARPLPPRPFTASELIERARRPGVRFVVLGSRRPNADPVRAALADEFAAFALPEGERRAAELRGILVLERR